MQRSRESRMEAKHLPVGSGEKQAASYQRLRMSCEGGKRKTKEQSWEFLLMVNVNVLLR